MSEEKIRHIIEVFENDYCEKCSEFNCLEGSMEEIITAMKQLQQENQELKKQLDYLRSGEYYNQLRFENEMLQQVVDTNGVPSEVYDYIDCTHRNTELLEENQELKKQLEEYKKWYQDELEENSKLSELWCDSRAKIRKLENQQKEFISYLEYQVKLQEELNDKLLATGFEEILSKYRKIIGESK